MKYLNIENLSNVRECEKYNDYVAEVAGVDVEYRLEIDDAHYDLVLAVYIEGRCWDSVHLKGEKLIEFHQKLRRMESDSRFKQTDERRNELHEIMNDLSPEGE